MSSLDGKKVVVLGEVTHLDEIQDADYVTVSVSTYNSIIESMILLQKLRELGVDNWEGYQEAVSTLRNR